MPKKEPINIRFEKDTNAITPSNHSIQDDVSNYTKEGDFLFYGAGQNSERIKVFISNEDVWITQLAMTEIFDVDKSGISRHLKNIFESGELDRNSVVAKIATTGRDGKTYQVDHYNLDAILSVGYRVNSRKAIQFRRWASEVLKEYLIKGFAMDDERLKKGKQLFGKDYFEELLERIREIRASERRFYQKITEIYIQCSYDYDQNSALTQQFFAHAQNKLEYAITGMTAAEIIKLRANHNLPNMGLTTWKSQQSGGKIRKSDTTIAKNYLAEGEISDLNKLVTMFLDYAENLARKGRLMSMKNWTEKLDDFLKFNEYQLLQNYGKIKKSIADSHAVVEYEKFKPVQDQNYKSDFDTAVEMVREKVKHSEG